MNTKSRMFDIVTRTWNPVTGCHFNCVYCWAKRLAEGRLKRCLEKYRDGFKPRFHENEFRTRFRPNAFVFVCDMGDLFGPWVPSEWIERVIEYTKKFPMTWFLFQTKNPARYFDFLDLFDKNAILGTTIETNLHFPEISKAPPPVERYKAMKDIRGFWKMVSIEPVMNFSISTLCSWIRDIKPGFVYIGYDNYNNKLPEPPLRSVLKLIDCLQQYTEVRTKTLRDEHG